MLRDGLRLGEEEGNGEAGERVCGGALLLRHIGREAGPRPGPRAEGGGAKVLPWEGGGGGGGVDANAAGWGWENGGGPLAGARRRAAVSIRSREKRSAVVTRAVLLSRPEQHSALFPLVVFFPPFLARLAFHGRRVPVGSFVASLGVGGG